MRLGRRAHSCVFLIALAAPVLAAQSAPDELTVPHPVARRVSAGDLHKYFVYLDVGDKASIGIFHVGLLDLTVYSPSGEVLARPRAATVNADLVFTITGTKPGRYEISVAAPKSHRAKYEI